MTDLSRPLAALLGYAEHMAARADEVVQDEALFGGGDE